MLPTIIADNQKTFFYAVKKTHISTFFWIKVRDRKLTTLETNGVDSKWVKVPSQDRIVLQ